MQLNIPQQCKPTGTSSPSDPQQLANVLSSLSNTNMGEITKQIFHLLHEHNRQTMPVQDRLDNLEQLRVPAREIFINLKKHFINRTLPLPEKSQKIINLNQSILQELIYGYEIIVSEAANNTGDKVNEKTLAVAICRAINYLSEMLLRCNEVYQPCPKNLWRDTHQLYTFAESEKLLDISITVAERGIDKTTIADSYKQILLFALARPITLRQSDSSRIYKELFTWSQYATIRSEVSEDMVDHVFCMKTNEDKAPHYLCEESITSDFDIRVLDTRELVTHITSLANEQANEKPELTLGDTIPLDILTTLIHSWGESPKRRFSRAERQDHIRVAIGLAKICQAMKEQQEKKPLHDANAKFGFVQLEKASAETPIDGRHDFFQSSENPNKDPDFTLQSIDKVQEQATSTVVGTSEENEWDLVAKGRVRAAGYEKNSQLLNETEGAEKRSSEHHWEVVNISPGGYCLRWNSDNTSTAQIGELIALQEFDSHDHARWHIGAIRWMQFSQTDGLEVGVQILSPQVIAATAQRINRLDETPFDCLMLPGIEVLNQTSSAILPSHAFKTNAKLIVRVAEHKLNITLNDIKEHTGSFTQFAYNNTNLDQQINKQAKKEDTYNHRDDFDELWSSL
jgi:hypothetical protein